MSEHETSYYNIFKVTATTSGSLVFNAVLTGIINCGITGKTFAPPLLSMSNTPCTAINLYGSHFSLIPSKKIGR